MRISSIASTASLITLSAALSAGFAPPAHATHRCEDYGLKPIGLFALAQPVDEFVANRNVPAAVEEFLALFQEEDQRGERELGGLGLPELTQLLREMNRDPTATQFSVPVPAALQGIAGFVTTILLQHLIQEKGQPIARKTVYGKIRDYVFLKEDGSGHINVDVCTDDAVTGRRELFHWDVEVPAGIDDPGERLTVTPRDDGSPADPFAGIIALPAAALDAANPHSIWARDLDHKLGVQRGSKIIINHVYYRDLSTPDFKRLESGHHFYNSTPQSCIDLFTEGPPPATFGELIGNDYCLGRCAQPAIFNSGD